MDKIATFEIWAPPESGWSAWVKPVLFAETATELFSVAGQTGVTEPDVAWAPSAGGQTAVIVDLPGEMSVLVGMALARRGFRPVPLYNSASGLNPVVNVEGIRRRLFASAAELKALAIPPQAPPAFLLDSTRMGNVSPSPGRFDNRWLVFPQDFPSANYLVSQGIGCVLLVQDTARQPKDDLAHVLLRWQEAHIAIMVYGVQSGGPFQPITVSRPGGFKRLWYRALVLAGLRRHSGGGFGALVPEESDAGYG
jgi:hypothetical protein